MSLRGVAAVAFVLLLAIQPAAGHAVLVESAPAANSSVPGPDVSVRLRFNSRIDAARSRLTLVLADGSTEPLKIPEQSSPDTLTSTATGLKPGAYRIRWQVLATDGHITRGDIPFTVTGK
ncbi:MAG TPA: copper resistance CopC family protein [Candidatus Acidoferrales bacterium]|nr:copper resistance CopC family protein [Candidatus Acidoferrales bacterium]